MMISFKILSFAILLFVVVALLVQNTTASTARPPRNNGISTMADALKYLQDLDTYYSDKARVRFGKRAAMVQTLRNRLLYSNNINNKITTSMYKACSANFAPAEELF